MNSKKLSLKILPDRMAVCRFEATAALPDWLDEIGFYSITRTQEELTLVCREVLVAPGTTSESGWRCFGVEGTSDLALFSLCLNRWQKAVFLFLSSPPMTQTISWSKKKTWQRPSTLLPLPVIRS
jgi:hypothetical protein